MRAHRVENEENKDEEEEELSQEHKTQTDTKINTPK